MSTEASESIMRIILFVFMLVPLSLVVMGVVALKSIRANRGERMRRELLGAVGTIATGGALLALLVMAAPASPWFVNGMVQDRSLLFVVLVLVVIAGGCLMARADTTDLWGRPRR